MAYSFEWLIEPITPTAFFKDYYERGPLIISGKKASKFQSLLGVAQIEQFLNTTSPTLDDVVVVDAARDIEPEEYTIPGSGAAPEIDPARVYQLFGSGATISLSSLQNRLPQFVELCNAISHHLSHTCQANIYLSPPNAQGFKTHYDSHDVFVLQVFGSKIWTIYDTLIELPLHNQGFDFEKHIPGPPSREFTLRAGDVFYCPRGLFHSARSTNESSLHVTLGVIGKTWADVLVEAVSVACLESPEFRKNLPTGFANAGFDTRAAADTFRKLIETVARNARLEPILERIANDFVMASHPDLSGCLQELNGVPEVTIDTAVVGRPHLIHLIRQEGENLVIKYGSTTITLPIFTREAVNFAISGRPFKVRDLPGQLDDPGKVVLVRRLIKEGMLMRSNGTTAAPSSSKASALVN
jgi:hypothetical protein